MGNYALYIFDEEIARRYYGQESKLFYLFFEHENATGSKKQLINKQIDYITKSIPVQSLQNQLNEAFHDMKEHSCVNNTHRIELGDRSGKGELKMGSKFLQLVTDGTNTNEVETIFFEVIRKCEPTFFAVSVDKYKYGWLRPLKKDLFLAERRVN